MEEKYFETYLVNQLLGFATCFVSLGEINPCMPAVWLVPKTTMPANDPRYVAPLYKTAIRAGVLSTTGHSTNFVIAMLLRSDQKQSYWIQKGTALLTQISN